MQYLGSNSQTHYYSRISHENLPQRGSNANGRTSIFDINHYQVMKVVPERKHCFLANISIVDIDIVKL